MNKRLSLLFEEDVELQDALEDLDDLSDDEDDILISALEARTEDHNQHLFSEEDEEPINDDGLTDKEEHEVNVAMLDDDEIEALDDDEDFEDLEDDI